MRKVICNVCLGLGSVDGAAGVESCGFCCGVGMLSHAPGARIKQAPTSFIDDTRRKAQAINPEAPQIHTQTARQYTPNQGRVGKPQFSNQPVRGDLNTWREEVSSLNAQADIADAHQRKTRGLSSLRADLSPQVANVTPAERQRKINQLIRLNELDKEYQLLAAS